MSTTTQKQVAQTLGLSSATVSLALNDSPKIKATTKALIVETATKLGYKKNAYVSNVMSGVRLRHTNNCQGNLAYLSSIDIPKIGPDNKDAFLRGQYNAFKKIAEDNNFNVEFFCIDNSSFTNERLTQILKAKGICGIILNKILPTNNDLKINWDRFSVVSHSYVHWFFETHHVVNDFHYAIQCLLKKMQGKGYRRIGLSTDKVSSWAVEGSIENAYQGYCSIESNFHPLPIFTGGDIGEKRYDGKFLEWYRTNTPDAIIGNLNTIFWLKHNNIEFPKDVAFATYYRTASFPFAASGIETKSATLCKAVFDLIAYLHKNDIRGLPSENESIHKTVIRGEFVQYGTF